MNAEVEIDMDSAQDMSNQDMENANNVMDDNGQPKEDVAQSNDTDNAQGQAQDASDPLFVQKRLKQQKRAHDREIRELHAKIESIQSNAGRPPQPDIDANPYDSNVMNGGIEEQIHKAVSYALGQRERDERKAKETESVAHIQRQYQDLHNHLDRVADKYDNFDDVVRGKDMPFTPHMRDAALMLDMDHSNPGNAGEVLYHLGTNPEELSRISKLHPLDQAREMVKLSKALIRGGEPKASDPRPLGQIKNSPVTNSHVVNEKTSVGSLRQRMKSGNWK